VYYREPGGIYKKAGSSSGLSYTITGLANGFYYEVAVRALNAAGTGPLSGESSLTLPPRLFSVPDVKASGSKLAVTWPPVPGAASYEVYYREGQRDPAGASLAGAYTTTAAEITQLAAGKSYYIWVRARNAGGLSPWGDPALGLLPSAVHAGLGALWSWLSGLPENALSNPYVAAVQEVNLKNLGGGTDGMRPFFESFQGRYVALDLDACTGATLGFGEYTQSTGGRPDKDKLVAVILPESTTRVGFNNFQGSVNLKTVVFPPRLRSIGIYAFDGCGALESVDLPATLTSIQAMAFRGCSSLKDFVIRAPVPPSIGADVLGLHPAAVIRVPAESVAAYQIAPGWNAYTITALRED
jgi:hypothetical protein